MTNMITPLKEFFDEKILSLLPLTPYEKIQKEQALRKQVGNLVK